MPIPEPVFSALNEAGVRYVVVGGLSVVLHGHLRMMADVDVVLNLEPDAARRAMEALKAIGLKARAPVAPAAFADPVQREWAVARPQDLSDIEALEALKKRAPRRGSDA